MYKILLENAFFVSISKPAGISVHNDENSLVQWCEKQKLDPHFVNRLDRETSGIILIAKSSELHGQLASALSSGEKMYRSLLCGAWKNKFDHQTWNWALSDKAEGRDSLQGAKPLQKECLSLVKLVKQNKYFSEVAIALKTGRQHQIRRHAALSGQSILGDNRYGNEKHNTKMATLYNSQRLQLHAEKLRFSFDKQNFEILDSNFSIEQFFVF